MRIKTKAVLLFLAIALLAPAAGAQDRALNSVPRYDDADEFLPPAERKNAEGVRLFLRQQPDEATLTAASDRNVSIKIIARIPEGASRGVILLVGGTSVLSIGPDDKLDRSFNYTSRSRDYWWSQGIATFLVDAPSDHLDKEGLTPYFRTTKEFATDMRAVVGLIASKFNKPLHAVGHSNGAILKPALFKQVTGSPVHILAGDKDDYDDPDGCLKFVASLPGNARPHFAVTVYKGATFAWDSRFSSAPYEAGANKGKGGIVNTIANAEIARESQAFAVSYFKKYLAAD